MAQLGGLIFFSVNCCSFLMYLIPGDDQENNAKCFLLTESIYEPLYNRTDDSLCFEELEPIVSS